MVTARGLALHNTHACSLFLAKCEQNRLDNALTGDTRAQQQSIT
jgi:hypothetical protein